MHGSQRSWDWCGDWCHNRGWCHTRDSETDDIPEESHSIAKNPSILLNELLLAQFSKIGTYISVPHCLPWRRRWRGVRQDCREGIRHSYTVITHRFYCPSSSYLDLNRYFSWDQEHNRILLNYATLVTHNDSQVRRNTKRSVRGTPIGKTFLFPSKYNTKLKWHHIFSPRWHSPDGTPWHHSHEKINTIATFPVRPKSREP